MTGTRGSTVHGRVAGEVRAWLGRRNISANQAAKKLGWTQPYISRRISGHVPFNVGDLDQLGELLGVDPATFFAQPAETGTAGGSRINFYQTRRHLAVAA